MNDNLNTDKDRVRTRWILYGLLPYAVMPVITFRGVPSDPRESLWMSVEQVLGSQGMGIMSNYNSRFGAFAEWNKNVTTAPEAHGMFHIPGRGFSLNQNLRRFATFVGSGFVRTKKVTFVEDAVDMVKFASAILRQRYHEGFEHALLCEKCLEKPEYGLLAQITSIVFYYA